MNETKTLMSQVGYTLKNFKKTRNDDELLVKTVSEIFHLNAIKKASSIERLRRLYNQNGDYLATKKSIREKRQGYSQDFWKKALGYNN